MVILIRRLKTGNRWVVSVSDIMIFSNTNVYINTILFGESYIERNTLITHRLKNAIFGASAYPQLKKKLKVEESFSEKYFGISTSMLI